VPLLQGFDKESDAGDMFGCVAKRRDVDASDVTDVCPLIRGQNEPDETRIAFPTRTQGFLAINPSVLVPWLPDVVATMEPNDRRVGGV
jgi:hypothetical protein